jgi:hypothetical protein
MGGQVLRQDHHDWIKDASGGQFDPSQHDATAAPGAGDDGAPGAPPAEMAAAPGGGPAPGVWNAPFGLGACDNTGDASGYLLDIRAMLTAWSGVGYGNEMAVVDKAIGGQLTAMSHNGQLTAAEADALTAVGLLAAQAIRNAQANLVAAISKELDKFSGVAAQDALDDAAELLHQEFGKGDGSNKIGDLKDLVAKAGKMAGDIKKYVGYAKTAKSALGTAGKLEDITKALDGFKSKLSTVESTLSLASDVATLAGKVGEKPNSTANDINKIKAGLDIVGFAISKSSVPLIGAWWDSYIKPATEKALAQLQTLDTMIDKATRSAVADEWWQAASKGMAAPSVTDSGLNGALLEKVFPGGQPMLDFMWAFFRGNPPTSAPSEVVKRFLKFRKQFNAGVPADQQLQTDAAFSNLWNLFGTDQATNLMSFVQNNKDFIWAAEYGALPHP